MKIRVTKKLLNISRIKEFKDTSPLSENLPGEWYASLVSLNAPGKHAIHFLHYPTLISIIILGKSINNVLPSLPGRISSLLDRHGYSELIPSFQIHSKFEIFATNSKNILAYMNEMKNNIEYHLSKSTPLEKIEDIEYKNLFGGKLANNDYVTPEEILSSFRSKMVNC
jgi:hypothetical protein